MDHVSRTNRIKHPATHYKTPDDVVEDDAHADLGACRRQHERRSDRVAEEQVPARAGIDQHAEQPRRDDAADRGAGRIDHRDREGARFERKNLARREISRARRRRSEEKDHDPRDGLRRAGEHADVPPRACNPDA